MNADKKYSSVKKIRSRFSFPSDTFCADKMNLQEEFNGLLWSEDIDRLETVRDLYLLLE
jgi:hypothetical protein